ncbi:MAG: L-glutamate gamma-semialdehyde dehydrogenase [Thermoanaerobaculia bacterium]
MKLVEPFKNEPLTDFSKEENRKKQEEAIEKVLKEKGKEYPLIIGGRRVFAKEKFNSINPSKTEEVLGVFQKADAKLAVEALEEALKAFEEWRWHSAKERAIFLFRVANLMRKKRFLLNAWMILEVGKNWVEADADTAEAIDFCEFYGREMIRLSEHQELTTRQGEAVELKYIPLGVGVVIPPWNFPCAILVGMTTASIVTGNTVILKPASDTPGIAYQFFQILEEAGMPPGVVNFLTGPGSIAGETLVLHPKTRFIAFTGSKEVGLRIFENASKLQKGQIWLKRTILEMGGKDFIIVDDEADMETALQSVYASAWGFQGQKCSACSRLILHEKVYDEFIEKFIPMVEKMKIGDTRYFENYLGPVANKPSYEKILEYIEIGKGEGKLLVGGGAHKNKDGFFILPTVFGDVKPTARIAQEEIFGPVLAIIKVKNFEEAIEVANGTEYGLTGALITQNRKKIWEGKKKLHCGNLYINRKCTGALVGVHPFGGFNMSGTDSKAGGKDYLFLFTQAKSISEAL